MTSESPPESPDRESRGGSASHLTSLPVSVRRATGCDARAILGCLASAFEPYRASYTKAGYLNTVLTAEMLQERFASMVILVAVPASGDAVGTVSFHMTTAHEGHLRGMAVLPEYAGAGVAERLLSTAERELVRRGCSRVTLDTTAPLLRAIRFYEKRGYRRSGTVTPFFGMSLWEYVKTLDSTAGHAG